MQEGMLSLMQMAKTCAALARLAELQAAGTRDYAGLSVGVRELGKLRAQS